VQGIRELSSVSCTVCSVMTSVMMCCLVLSELLWHIAGRQQASMNCCDIKQVTYFLQLSKFCNTFFVVSHRNEQVLLFCVKYCGK